MRKFVNKLSGNIKLDSKATFGSELANFQSTAVDVRERFLKTIRRTVSRSQ